MSIIDRVKYLIIRHEYNTDTDAILINKVYGLLHNNLNDKEMRHFLFTDFGMSFVRKYQHILITDFLLQSTVQKISNNESTKEEISNWLNNRYINIFHTLKKNCIKIILSYVNVRKSRS